MSNTQYVITKQWIDKFKAEIDNIAQLIFNGYDREYISIMINSLSNQLYDLQEELKTMEPKNNE
jgi:hypothetical protein